jgi:hypothetical protein
MSDDFSAAVAAYRRLTTAERQKFLAWVAAGCPEEPAGPGVAQADPETGELERALRAQASQLGAQIPGRTTPPPQSGPDPAESAESGPTP